MATTPQLPPTVTAVDAVQPAFERTKATLFKPFRWATWWRVALLGFVTGELSSGGGCNLNLPSNLGDSSDKGDQFAAAMQQAPGFDPAMLAGIGAVLVAVLLFAVPVWLLLLYIGSVCRFVLFETVMTGQVSIRAQFRKWQQPGMQYFKFMLAYSAIAFVCIGIIVAPFLYFLWRNSQGGRNVFAALGTLLLLIPFLFLFLIIALSIYVLVKDFAVPMMALEGLPIGQALRRLSALVDSQKGDTAVYLLIKLVLNIAAGIALAIVMVILVVSLAVPIALLVSLSGGLKGLTIMAMLWIFFAAIAFLAMFALLCTPFAIFFPAYAMHYLSGRYPLLWNMLHPPAQFSPMDPSQGSLPPSVQPGY